jgi:hypothetical protein
MWLDWVTQCRSWTFINKFSPHPVRGRIAFTYAPRYSGVDPTTREPAYEPSPGPAPLPPKHSGASRFRRAAYKTDTRPTTDTQTVIT